jgi:hypothetical protein
MKVFYDKEPQNLVQILNCSHVNSFAIIILCMPHWWEWNWNQMQDGDTWKQAINISEISTGIKRYHIYPTLSRDSFIFMFIQKSGDILYS